MSHISLYEAEKRRDQVLNTPLPKHRGQRVHDFIGRGVTTPLQRNFFNLATPGTRRIDTAPDLVAEIEQDENSEYKSLCGRVWKTYSVSPMFNFKTDKTSLESLKKSLMDQTNVDGEEASFNVAIERGLRGNREDAECLKIKILKNQNRSSAPLCALYFLAVHSQELLLRSSATNLPLLLTCGSERLVQEIITIVERNFDCVINPLMFDPLDLKWMVALWSGTDSIEKDDEDGNHENVDPTHVEMDSVKLRFELPRELKNDGLDHIDVKFTAEDIRSFWKKFKTDNEMEMSLDQMERFHEILQNHLKECFGIQFDKLTLTSIILPTMTAALNGSVKITRVDKIKTVLGFLTSLCQEKFVLRADPSLGVPIDMMR